MVAPKRIVVLPSLSVDRRLHRTASVRPLRNHLRDLFLTDRILSGHILRVYRESRAYVVVTGSVKSCGQRKEGSGERMMTVIDWMVTWRQGWEASFG